MGMELWYAMAFETMLGCEYALMSIIASISGPVWIGMK